MFVVSKLSTVFHCYRIVTEMIFIYLFFLHWAGPSLFFGQTWISPLYGNYEPEDDGLDTDEEQFTDEAGEEREQGKDFR